MNTFNLTNQEIETVIKKVSEFFKMYKIEQKEQLRTILALEDTLLNYQDKLGEKGTCSLKCFRRFGRIRIEITAAEIFCLQSELVLVSGKLNMLDTDVLRNIKKTVAK